MEPITWVLVASLIFGGWQYNRAERLESALRASEEEVVWLGQSVEKEAEKASEMGRIANENSLVVKSISSSLDSCREVVEGYQESNRIFEAVNQTNRVTIEELEKRLSGSELSSCRVPNWLVDEITGNRD